MKYTILGGGGFIGGHLGRYLLGCGHEVQIPSRDLSDLRTDDCGHVIYAIGLTGNFRQRPYDAIDAHVTLLVRMLRALRFDSLLYLSSTRIYGGLAEDQIATEEVSLPLRPSLDSLYDLSKLLGEAACLASPSPTVRIARLSNVYGQGQSESTFLGSIVRDVALGRPVTIGESSDSGKDYVAVEDAVRLLADIAVTGTSRIYNVASGRQVCHDALTGKLTALTGCGFEFASNGSRRVFPQIDIERIRTEYGFAPRSVLDDLPDLLSQFRSNV